MYTETKKHFMPPQTPQPFWIELTGTSYCDYTYKISRTLQAANVYVVEYIILGTGTLHINGREYHPSAGDFYLLQPGVAHDYHSSAEDPWTKIFANVYGPLCRSVIDVYGLSNVVHIKNCDMHKPLQEFIDIANSVELKESQIMTQCAAKFVEMIASAAAQMSTNTRTDNAEANLLCDFLNANTQRTVSVTELSNIIYRSPDYTIKLFKKTFGFTPYDYQISQKMNICKRRLCTSNDSISDIAYDLGYADPQHFSKLFKSRCNMSPRQYRNQFWEGEAKKNCADGILVQDTLFEGEE